jgi:prolyl-tRNA editing enzyme YbaK/EbsC (Cys-tRNA(Pro) deacylase)
MVNALPDAAQRVEDAAKALGLTISVVVMPATTRTAEDAAAACGCAVGQIVKSLVFQGKGTKRPYLFLVSGANRVNEKAVAGPVGEAIMRADVNFVRDTTGYAIGGIPPLGHDTTIATFIDADLLKYDVVWAAAGTPHTVFSVDPKALRDATGATTLTVT